MRACVRAQVRLVVRVWCIEYCFVLSLLLFGCFVIWESFFSISPTNSKKKTGKKKKDRF